MMEDVLKARTKREAVHCSRALSAGSAMPVAECGGSPCNHWWGVTAADAAASNWLFGLPRACRACMHTILVSRVRPCMILLAPVTCRCRGGVMCGDHALRRWRPKRQAPGARLSKRCPARPKAAKSNPVLASS